MAKLKVCSFFSWCCFVGLVLLACGRSSPQNAREAPTLLLHASDAEVWSYRVTIDGELRGIAMLRSCEIAVDARAFHAHSEAARFHAEVELRPGLNTVQARCQTEDQRELRSQAVHWDVRLRDAPLARAHASVVAGKLTLSAELRESESEPAPIVDYAWFSEDFDGLHPLGQGATLTIALPVRGLYFLRATDARGRSDEARVEFPPTSSRMSIVYGVLPPLFGPRGLYDVTAALDSLEALGVDTLWLSPLFETLPHDFGYAVTDYFRIRSDYGDPTMLEALIEAAHQRHMRVLLDLPANHTSRRHRYFADQSVSGKRSHYYSFYVRDAAGAATHYFDWNELLNLDYQNAEVSRFMLEVAEYWLREGHVDGYRLDAAWGIRARSPTFWPRFVDDVRRIRPGAPLIAEASILDDFYTQQGFDAAYDWTESLGHAAWEHVFDDKPGIARRLHAAVARTNEHTLRFLNNNDTGERFITRHGEALTRVATVALLTLPGIPCLYSFDEVGAEFKPYESLEPVHVRNDSLREFHQRWIWLRRTHPALSGSGFEVVDVGSRDELYAYLRSGGGRKVLVLLNFSRSPVTRDLPLPQSFTDLMSGETLASERGRLHVALGPWEARALEQR